MTVDAPSDRLISPRDAAAPDAAAGSPPPRPPPPASLEASPAGDPQSDAGLDDDRLYEECGVFGLFGHENAAAFTALGLHALQHRGQEACGISTFDGEQFHTERFRGLVSGHFDRKEVLDRLPGTMAIGHNRYSTTGASTARNIQPLFCDISGGGLAVAHNGNLTNARSLREKLISSGAIFHATSDTEVILHLVARSKRRDVVDRVIEGLRQVEGAYALVFLTNDMMIGARDPVGIRPLVLGRTQGGAWVLASETCALDMIEATFVREIENGELVAITAQGVESHRLTPIKQPAQPCIFEYIYFARPDSVVGGLTVYDIRKAMGTHLAAEAPADVDVIVPIPDSGMPAAIGYARASGLPMELGIIRNHYVTRTFIQPDQSLRDFKVKLKHSANAGVVRGKRIVLIDDSVVRGTTSKKIVALMYDAGAKEVHMRIACPPIRWPDFYGIDTPTKQELLAAGHDIEGMRDYMGATSLAFLSIEGVYRALGHDRRDPAHPQFSDHCFTGRYPTPLTDHRADELPGPLSVLVEA